MSDRNNKELAEQLVENIYAFGVDVNIIERTLNSATKELEQLRAENERLRGHLREIRQSCLKSDLSNDTIANIYGRCQAILKEPDNDE